jgi:hypothetical protein
MPAEILLLTPAGYGVLAAAAAAGMLQRSNARRACFSSLKLCLLSDNYVCIMTGEKGQFQ